MSDWSYKTFCTPEEIEVFQRVKRRSMRLGRAGRRVAAGLVGGKIGDSHSEKEFVLTRRGLYRLANSDNSDNSTETVAHIAMGVKATICMGLWQDSMQPWLREHNVSIKSEDWFRLVDSELRSEE